MAFLASRRFFIFSGILFAGCRASTEVTSTSVSTTTTTTMSGIEVDLGTGTNASRTTGIVLLASPSPSASSTVMVPPPPPPHSPQPFTTNNVFRIIQLLTPPPPSPPICCLRPLPGSRKEDDDDALLLSFEDWKVRQGGGSSPQGSGHGNGRRHVSSSAVGGGSGNGNRSVTGQKDSREKDKDDSESDHAETKDAAHSPPASSPAPSSPSSPTDSNASSSTPDETNDKVNGNGGVMGVSSSQAHQQIPTQPHLLIDRFNYASLDCSARVHSAHKGAKSASAILSSKRDRYMLSPCGTSNANAHGIGMNGNEKGHFVVVELCDDIRIDTVQLANFEFFSGVFKDVTISAAKTHPVGKEGWTGAGVYRAKNVRGVQSFHTPTLRDFYRYIRIDFHSHYGNEYYCPVSLLRVFGLTHLEQWKLDQVQDAEEEQHERESKEQLDELPTVVEVVRIAKEEEVIVVPPVVLGDVPAKKGGPDIQPIPASPLEAHHDSESSAPPPPPSITHDSTTPSSPASEASINVADSQSSAAATVIVTASPSQDSPHPPPHSSHSSPQAHQNPPPSSPSSSSLSHTRPQPYAAAGESIYRVIMTRLSALEHNATLYARYAEEHSLSIHRILQRYGEELGRVEGLGRGVGREVQGMGKTLRSAVEGWEGEKVRVDGEVERLVRRVEVLSEEITLEKRLNMAQLCLLLTVLVFLGLTRGSNTHHHHHDCTPPSRPSTEQPRPGPVSRLRSQTKVANKENNNHTRTNSMNMRLAELKEWGRRHVYFPREIPLSGLSGGRMWRGLSRSPERGWGRSPERPKWGKEVKDEEDVEVGVKTEDGVRVKPEDGGEGEVRVKKEVGEVGVETADEIVKLEAVEFPRTSRRTTQERLPRQSTDEHKSVEFPRTSKQNTQEHHSRLSADADGDLPPHLLRLHLLNPLSTPVGSTDTLTELSYRASLSAPGPIRKHATTSTLPDPIDPAESPIDSPKRRPNRLNLGSITNHTTRSHPSRSSSPRASSRHPPHTSTSTSHHYVDNAYSSPAPRTAPPPGSAPSRDGGTAYSPAGLTAGWSSHVHMGHRSARKWARSAHLHHVKRTPAHGHGQVVKRDVKGKGQELEEDEEEDVFGKKRHIGSASRNEAVGSSSHGGRFGSPGSESGTTDGWVDTDDGGSESDASGVGGVGGGA